MESVIGVIAVFVKIVDVNMLNLRLLANNNVFNVFKGVFITCVNIGSDIIMHIFLLLHIHECL